MVTPTRQRYRTGLLNSSSSVSVRVCALSSSAGSTHTITPAKEDRKLYTLDPIPDATVAPPTLDTAPTVTIPGESTVLATPILKTSSTPTFSGPIRTVRQPRPGRGPPYARADKNGADKSGSPSTVSPTNTTTPQVGTPLPEVDTSQVHTSKVNPPQAATDAASLTAEQVPDDNASDSRSYTSTLPDVFEVGMDDSAPPATGPWMIIDHLTGEVIADDNQSTPPAPTVPTAPAVSSGPSLPGVEVATALRLGTPYLVETPPTLLSEDEDVRPQWLITAVNAFLRLVPYVGSLGKVVDLYLAQEARLGYPQLVCSTTCAFLMSSVLTILVHSTSTPISQPAD